MPAARIVPWVVSAVAHVGLIGVGFVATWTVVMLQGDREPATIVADFDALAYDPVVRTAPAESTSDALRRIEVPPVEPLRADRELATTDFGDLPQPPADAGAELPRFDRSVDDAAASFVGLSATNARRIVYVIDASGSMIGALPIVLKELERSLDGLTPRQQFSVAFFRRNEALVVPPVHRLIRATEDEKRRVMTWCREDVTPEGRSNPIEAIRAAIRLKPDVIFVLSDNITGSGEFEIDQAELLALLDRLNLADEDGRRPVQINCVQFLDPDPLDTLRRIAEVHGGPRGYKFLDRAELGLQRP